MKFLGKLSFYLSILVLLLGLIVLFLLPVLKVHLVAQNTWLILILIGEALALLLGLFALKTRHGKLGLLISLVIAVAIVLYLVFSGENPIQLLKDVVKTAVKRVF